jgi:hypothetical protein
MTNIDPMKCISEFDLDYVKVFYSRNKIFGTISFLNSLIKNKISFVNATASDKIIIKALMKDYKFVLDVQHPDIDKLKIYYEEITKENAKKNKKKNMIKLTYDIADNNIIGNNDVNNINDEIKDDNKKEITKEYVQSVILDIKNKYYYPSIKDYDSFTGLEDDNTSQIIELLFGHKLITKNLEQIIKLVELQIQNLFKLSETDTASRYKYSSRYESVYGIYNESYNEKLSMLVDVMKISDFDVKKLVKFDEIIGFCTNVIFIPIRYSLPNRGLFNNKVCIVTDNFELKHDPFPHRRIRQRDQNQFRETHFNMRFYENPNIDPKSRELFGLMRDLDKYYINFFENDFVINVNMGMDNNIDIIKNFEVKSENAKYYNILHKHFEADDSDDEHDNRQNNRQRAKNYYLTLKLWFDLQQNLLTDVYSRVATSNTKVDISLYFYI